MPGDAYKDLPSTSRRPPKHAQDPQPKARNKAIKAYGGGRRAHQGASAALKSEHPEGGSAGNARNTGAFGDKRPAGSAQAGGKTCGVVDGPGYSEEELLERAGKLNMEGAGKTWRVPAR
jgi:hypothetical protein